MKDYKGRQIYKNTEKNIGEVDKVWYEIHENGCSFNKKFETLKDAKEFAKKRYDREQRLEKAYQKYINARDEYYRVNKEEGYIYGLYK